MPDRIVVDADLPVSWVMWTATNRRTGRRCTGLIARTAEAAEQALGGGPSLIGQTGSALRVDPGGQLA